MAPFNRAIWSHLTKWFGIPTISLRAARKEEGRVTAPACCQGPWPPARGAGRALSAHLPFPEGRASLSRDLCPAHAPVPPVPMLWAQVSAPSPGIKKEQKFTHALCRSFPPASCRSPCWGRSPPRGVCHLPSDRSSLPRRWASARGPGLPLVATSLFNPQLQKAVRGQM